VFEELKIGTELQLQAEENNKFDPYAVIVYYNGHKLGYVPRQLNKESHKFLIMGYSDFLLQTLIV
jgi:hypothetical protein